MTLLEYVMKHRPEMEKVDIVHYECPKNFGLNDPEQDDCDRMTCEECWSRKYEGIDVINVMLDPGATMPTRAHEHDVGFDLYSREDIMILERGNHCFDTGVHMAIPVGYGGLIKSKSGLNVKEDITSDGVIDPDYTGSICVKLYNNGDRAVRIRKGQKISQLVIVPVITPGLELTDSMEETERGSGGFGSSGKF